jgi:hypothetical protein
MSLISWLIWSSSLATGSGVAGPPGVTDADADAEADPESEADGPDDWAVEPAPGALEVGLAVGPGRPLGAGVAPRGPQAITARPRRSAAAAAPSPRALDRCATTSP